jgi:alkanesulfonate monooxygenase SsuD/methylene tetrahydromethanopterin reductase-like flavin-dependent oxidoreductase (luciferase family)
MDTGQVPSSERIGLSLWTMQSTAARPGLWRALYRRLGEDARLAEELGFHAVWLGEHRVWYDGWCPAPVQALAHVAGSTSTIHLGTAMYLVPQHDPVAAARSIATLDHLSGGRVELGTGLGYRDAEFDALGLRRDRRGRLMDANLDAMEAVWRGELGDPPPVRRPAPPIWMGGMAEPAIARAARRGYGLMLPQTLSVDQYRGVAAAYREQAVRPGVVGALREVWVSDDQAACRRHRERIGLHMTEEAGSWWALKGRFGFEARDQVDRQVARGLAQVAAGPAEQVAEALREVLAAGVEYLALRPVFEFVEQAELHEQLRRLAEEVVPLLEGAAAA